MRIEAVRTLTKDGKMTRKTTHQHEAPVPHLKPCPLCGEPEPCDRGYGVQCRKCSLWLGDGTATKDLGGYVKVWNSRAKPTEAAKEYT